MTLNYPGPTPRQSDVLGEIATGNTLPWAKSMTFRKPIGKRLIVRLFVPEQGRDMGCS